MADEQELRLIITGDGAQAAKTLEDLRKTGQTFGKDMSALGGALTRGVTLPILAAGTAAVVMSVNFNKSMANVASLIPGNTQRVLELKKSVQDLAVASGQSTDTLAAGLYQVISAFGDTADAEQQLTINTRAAVAGLATTTDAINLTSAVTKAYGNTNKDAVQKAADLALMTVRLGQTTFPELAASVGRVTPLTKNLGVSQEELFATMAALTGVTGGAAEVSTQLRGAMQALMAPTDAAAAAMKKAGYANGAALVKAKGMAGALKFLTDEAKRSGKPLQEYIGSIEGQTVALALAGPQAADYKTKLEAMGKAAGATDAAFKEQTEGVNEMGFTFQQLQQQLAVTAQNLGDGLAPALRDALVAAQPLIDAVVVLAQDFAQADQGTQTLVLSLAGIAAAAGPVLQVVGGISTGLAGLGVAGAGGAAAVGLGGLGLLLGTTVIPTLWLANAAVSNLAEQTWTLVGASAALEAAEQKESVKKAAAAQAASNLAMAEAEHARTTRAVTDAKHALSAAEDKYGAKSRQAETARHNLMLAEDKAKASTEALQRAKDKAKQSEDNYKTATDGAIKAQKDFNKTAVDTYKDGGLSTFLEKVSTKIRTMNGLLGSTVRFLARISGFDYSAPGSNNGSNGPGRASGGWVHGAQSGFPATLHGTELVLSMDPRYRTRNQALLAEGAEALGIPAMSTAQANAILQGSSAQQTPAPSWNVTIPITGSRYDADFIGVTIRQVLRDELQQATIPSIG